MRRWMLVIPPLLLLLLWPLGSLARELWLVGSGVVLVSDDATHWSLVRVSQRLDAVTYGNGRFVAVGTKGTILTSESGKEWITRSKPGLEPLRGVAYGGDRFVLVGHGGRILVSTDGITWTPTTVGSDRILTAVAYGNGSFVTVGEGILATSGDGHDWVAREVPFQLYGVGYGQGRFIAVGEDEAQNGVLLTSTDLREWKEERNGRLAWQGITYGAGQFVIMGWNGGVLISPERDVWEYHFQAAGSVEKVAYGDGVFTAVGLNTISRSQDGVSWVPERTAIRTQMEDITFGGGRWVAVGIQDTWIH